MNGYYLRRTLEAVITEVMVSFPALILTGPRQSGKTTLLREMLGSSCEYLSLEDYDLRDVAQSDPKRFLEDHKPPVIIDEIQYAPRLMSGIKYRIDENRRATGQYVLTGSQNLLLLEKVTESLAGRAAILKLLPFSQIEKLGHGERPPVWERVDQLPSNATGVSLADIAQEIVIGGFPEPAVMRGRTSTQWFSSYIQTYIERDVSQVRKVADQPMFQRFMRLIAARSGRLLNIASVANDLRISAATVRDWLSILQVTHHVVLLPPYFANIGKTLIKTPKLYFTDTGLLCHLLGIDTGQQLMDSLEAGPIFETAVFAELYKSFLHRGLDPRLYFWRTEAGSEVDFVVEAGGKLIPIEVKFNSTPSARDAKSVRQFMRDFPKQADSGWLVHAGERVMPMGEGVTGIPFGVL